MTVQLLEYVLLSKGFGNTIISRISTALHSPDLNLRNFIPSTEDDLQTSTHNIVFTVSPAGVQQAMCVCCV
jgi:hypothetical protein